MNVAKTYVEPKMNWGIPFLGDSSNITWWLHMAYPFHTDPLPSPLPPVRPAQSQANLPWQTLWYPRTSPCPSTETSVSWDLEQLKNMIHLQLLRSHKQICIFVIVHIHIYYWYLLRLAAHGKKLILLPSLRMIPYLSHLGLSHCHPVTHLKRLRARTFMAGKFGELVLIPI